MRLHRLEMTAFGPFADTAAVDFDELGADGLFLLHGQTGAGKTTVLDAIAFALYGRVPGARGESKRLHSDHADPQTPPRVVLEATLGGRRLRLTRSPEFQRPKKRGTGWATEQAAATLEWLDGRGRNLSRIPDIGDEVNRLLGMSADQFFQVVLLPQGDFARFLQADNEDREKLLEKLFDTERFGTAEQWLAQRRRESGAELEAQRLSIDRLIAQVGVAAGAGATETVGPLEAVDWSQRLLATARTDLTAAATELERCQRDSARAQTAAEQQRRLQELRRRLTAARAQLDDYAAGADRRAQLTTELDRSRRAEPVAAALTEARSAAVLLRRRTDEARATAERLAARLLEPPSLELEGTGWAAADLADSELSGTDLADDLTAVASEAQDAIPAAGSGASDNNARPTRVAGLSEQPASPPDQSGRAERTGSLPEQSGRAERIGTPSQQAVDPVEQVTSLDEPVELELFSLESIMPAARPSDDPAEAKPAAGPSGGPAETESRLSVELHLASAVDRAEAVSAVGPSDDPAAAKPAAGPSDDSAETMPGLAAGSHPESAVDRAETMSGSAAGLRLGSVAGPARPMPAVGPSDDPTGTMPGQPVGPRLESAVGAADAMSGSAAGSRLESEVDQAEKMSGSAVEPRLESAVRRWSAQIGALDEVRADAESASALSAELASLRTEYAELTGRTEKLSVRRAELPESIRTAEVRLREAADAMAGLPGLAAECERLRTAASAAIDLVRRRKESAQARTDYETARSAHVDAREHTLDVRERRLAGMAAELAGALAEGQPCAVCGALEHPTPARPADAAATRADEEQAVADERAAETVRDRALARCTELERQIEVLIERGGDGDRAELAAALNAATERHEAAGRAAVRHDDLTVELARLRTDETRLQDELRDLESRCSAVQERMFAADRRLAELNERLREAGGAPRPGGPPPAPPGGHLPAAAPQ
uniref:AAA family ATPase n=1 Tax=Nocardia wallacei TaxID=480035 RepID=UPI002456EDCF